jgi:hypothetical protein
LNKESTVRNFRTVQIEGKRSVTRDILHYNLDVIISIGYRINSKRGTQFRIWASRVLKDYMLKGYAINHRVDKIENDLGIVQKELGEIKLNLNKSLPADFGVFFDGEVYDAYVFVTEVIRLAEKSILLIDNYVDDTVLTMLSKREKNIPATIYTSKITKQLSLDLQKHNSQYPAIEIKLFKESHDRFLIIDNKKVYHIGASLKDLGKKWFAFSKININPILFLDKLG